MDFCEFFRNIEANPDAIVKGITIREMMQAREHLHNCERCSLSSQRVLAKAPKDSLKNMYGEN